VLESTTSYILAVVFVATLVRSALGFGEALIAVPLLSLRVRVNVAAPLAVLVSVLVAALVIIQDWRRIDVRASAGLTVSALFGIPFGVLLLSHANDHLVKLVLGTIVVAFSIYALSMPGHAHLPHDHWGWLIGCGFTSGLLGGAYGMNGPPLVIYGALRRWPPQRFRATLQGYFLPASIAGLLGYAYMGLWDAAITRYLLLSLPGIAAAIVLGRAVNRRLQGQRFFQLVYGSLIAIGGVLLYQSFATPGGRF
jgi:uncharacterized membrane protein YfcA